MGSIGFVSPPWEPLDRTRLPRRPHHGSEARLGLKTKLRTLKARGEANPSAASPSLLLSSSAQAVHQWFVCSASPSTAAVFWVLLLRILVEAAFLGYPASPPGPLSSTLSIEIRPLPIHSELQFSGFFSFAFWLKLRSWVTLPLHQEMRIQRSLEVWKMGIVNYLDALKLQQKLVSDRKLGKIPDILLSLQHPPTYTLGKRKTYHNLLVPEDDLRSIGAELHYTQRGGDITYHGPHQAILYPIISLRGIGLGARKYVENLELTMIELASLYGVKARVGDKCETGVWVENRKIGAIGVQISSGITSHGLAFNIDPDMNYFRHIVPCGIADKEVTSLKMETEKVLPADEVIHEQLVSCFVRSFGFDAVLQKECASILLEEDESDKNLP